MTGAFLAGVVVGYLALGLTLAFAIGAAMRRADEADLQAAAPVDEPLYVPQEWFA